MSVQIEEKFLVLIFYFLFILIHLRLIGSPSIYAVLCQPPEIWVWMGQFPGVE